MKKILLITITLFSIAQLQAQGWGQIQKIVASDRGAGDAFGYAVAMDGDYAVVGAKAAGPSGTFRGAAYVFKKETDGGWVEITRLEDPNPSISDGFGSSVAIDGDYIIIGATGEDYDAAGAGYMGGAGAVYVYENDGNDNWVFVQKLVASDRLQSDINKSDRFGQSIAINGNYVAVAAPGEDEDENGENTLESTGSVYMFERDGSGVWNEVQKVVASDRYTNDYFGGYSEKGLDMDGNFLIVGAQFDDEDENGENILNRSGSAYVFERNGTGVWTEIQKIVASDRAQGEWFGSAVVISGDTIVVGAENEYSTGNTGTQHGAAYVFERDINGVWNEVQKIIPSYIQNGSDFGHALDIDANHIIIGAYSTDIGSQLSAGAAFMFEKDGSGLWNEVAVMYNINANEYEEFLGFDVALSGNYAFAGAYKEEEDETEMNPLGDAGAAYIFDVNEPNTLPPLSTLSVVESDIKTKIIAYPNPNRGHFTLTLGETYNDIQVVMRTILGQEIYKKTYQSVNEINLQINQPQGLYLVEITIDDNFRSKLKLIKQ